jgi:peptide/nickel transport system substrate-binding protein
MTPATRSGASGAPTIRRRALAGALTLALLAAGSACGNAGADAAGGASGGAPVAGGTLRFALLGSPESLDPHLNTSFAASNYGNSVFDKLTWQDPDTGEIGPSLAESWTANAAYTEFTFTLRRDVTFSDGTRFDATSVKHNLDQYVRGDPALGIKPNGATHLLGYQDTVVVADNVARVVFDRPAAGFLQFIAYAGNNQPAIIGEKTLHASAAERLKPENIVGTGPFTVNEYVPNERVVLAKRPDYRWAPPGLHHDGPAYLDRIELLTIPEASVRTGALQSGDVDAVFDVLPTDEAVLKAQGYTITSRTIPGVNLGWQFNLSLAPTDDVRVRRAIVHATDRAGFKATILAESEGEARSAIADRVQGFADYSGGALKFDLEQSKRLLDEAGWKVGADGVREKNGTKLRLKATGHVLVPNSRYTYESVQASLKEIGVEVDLLVDARNVPAEQITAEYHLINTNRSRNDVSVLNVNFNPTRANGSKIPADHPDRERIAKVLEAVDSTLEPKERARLARAAQDLVNDEFALFDPVFIPSQGAASKRLHDLDIDATARLHFLRAWLSPK